MSKGTDLGRRPRFFFLSISDFILCVGVCETSGHVLGLAAAGAGRRDAGPLQLADDEQTERVQHGTAGRRAADAARARRLPRSHPPTPQSKPHFYFFLRQHLVLRLELSQGLFIVTFSVHLLYFTSHQ